MSDLTANNIQTRAGSTKTVNKTENGTPIIEQGKETDKNLFLKMLVAQMQHQDPFNPQDPTQYVTQLAQFNQLEQSMALNENMEYLIGMTNGLLVNSAMSAASSLIGKNVEVYTPTEETDNAKNNNTNNTLDNTEDETKKETMTGIVESVHIKDGVVYMNVKDDKTGKVVSVEYAALVKVTDKNINTENKGE